MSSTVRYTVTDLEGLPDRLDDTRYELIDGVLHVSTQPRVEHQFAATIVAGALADWSRRSALGLALFAPGVIFTPEDAVAPDVIWISHQRAALGVDDGGHFTVAPELMIEVLSPGSKNARRDRDLKLKLYEREGVDEDWLIDWQTRTVEVYRREAGGLQRVTTLSSDDDLTSPLLPGFGFAVQRLWMQVGGPTGRDVV
jgi:Uma2 family endonuclease